MNQDRLIQLTYNGGGFGDALTDCDTISDKGLLSTADSAEAKLFLTIGILLKQIHI